MARYDEKFEAVGLDEGYLNLTPLMLAELPVQPSDEQIEKKGEELMRKIQRDVFEATRGLTLSLGMAPNRFLSKLCSEVNKPNGTFMLRCRRETVLGFLDKVPLRKVKHIGPHNGRIIAGLGRAKGQTNQRHHQCESAERVALEIPGDRLAREEARLVHEAEHRIRRVDRNVPKPAQG